MCCGKAAMVRARLVGCSNLEPEVDTRVEGMGPGFPCIGNLERRVHREAPPPTVHPVFVLLNDTGYWKNNI